MITRFETKVQRAHRLSEGWALSYKIAEELGTMLDLEEIKPIFERVKREPYPDCRFIIWALLRLNGFTLFDIGSIHKVHHTTVMHGITQCANRCLTEPAYKMVYMRLKDLYT